MPVVVSAFQTTSANNSTDNDTLVVTRTGSIAYDGDPAIFMSGDNQRTVIFGEVFSTERAIISQGANSHVYVAEGANVSGAGGIQTGENALVQNAGTVQATNGFALYIFGRLENSGTVMGDVELLTGAALSNTGVVNGYVQVHSLATSFSGLNSGYIESVDSRAAETYFTNSGEVGNFYAAERLELTNTGSIGSLRFDDGPGYILNSGFIGGRSAYFSEQADTYDGRLGVISATVYANAGADTLMGGENTDTFDGGADSDRLFGNGGDDTLFGGGAEADQLFGNSGDDTLYGGDNDRLAGGRDDDTYNVSLSDVGTIKLVERAGAGLDLVESNVSFKLGTNFEDLTLTGADINGTGNALANILIGSSGHNSLDAKGGSDEIYGGSGNDTLIGGKGVDELYGEGDLDTFVFLAGDTSALRTEADTIHGFLQSDGDRIDLSGFDANSKKKGIQDFDFIGTAGFSKTAGELRMQNEGDDTWISGDTNGDKKVDFVIHLDSNVVLVDTDFLL
jgi:Ca2+-binding RTX toxin-like protein